MYEFKNTSPVKGLRRGDLNINVLLDVAILHFSECPKFVTLAAHTKQIDLSPIHCFTYSKRSQMDFLVPKQDLVVEYDRNGGVFTFVEVISSDNFLFTLVVNENSRKGFLLNPYASTKIRMVRSCLFFAKRKGGACKRVRVIDGNLVPRL